MILVLNFLLYLGILGKGRADLGKFIKGRCASLHDSFSTNIKLMKFKNFVFDTVVPVKQFL